jgi:hypothetical protein
MNESGKKRRKARPFLWGALILLMVLGFWLGVFYDHKDDETRAAAEKQEFLEKIRKENESLRERLVTMMATLEEDAVSDEDRALWAELQRTAGRVEAEAYKRKGALIDVDIYRQAKWWMPLEDVLKSEENQPDTLLLTESPGPGRAMSIQPVLVYRLSREDGPVGLLIYNFGRVTNGLNAILISYFSGPDDALGDIDDFWQELKKPFALAPFVPAKSLGPEKLGFWYDEWRSKTMRASLAKVDYQAPGEPRSQLSILYTIPDYGDEEFPIELLKTSFEAFRQSRSRGEAPGPVSDGL